VVTVLFADLVGSTTIGERLDPEAFRALQARYFAALREVIERHGGTVEKYIGDAVMAVFGLPTLHEDDALRAVRAAAELTPALEPLNGELAAHQGLRLELRIGVHTGEVVAADTADRQAMVSGDTVNTAARLEAASQPGEILLGPLTFDLVRDAIAAEVLEDLAIRGRDEPVTAYRLLAITGTEAHVRQMDTPLVGRLGELDTLRAAFDRAVSGPGCELVTVLAPAGTGKSRLVREFLAGVASEARILRGRCLNYGDGITYWALGEILRAAADVEEADEPATVRSKVEALVAADRESTRVAGVLASVLGVAPEPASADDIAWAVRRTFTLLATERPLVVLVEDIHWAEPALLDLLEAIVDWSQGVPILLLCPARPELLEARTDWGAGRPNAAILHLEPLDASLASELIDVLPGGVALPAGVRQRVLEAAEGNPLFVEEFLAMLVDDGHLTRGADGAWTAAPSVDAVPVPHSISLLMAARLDSLDPPDRHVAQRASVVGRVFERGAVTELSPETERGSLGGRLLSLTRRQIIRPDAPGLDGDDAFRFRHVLIRDAAYEALTKAERADLHERFARWLERVLGERLPEYAEIYAHHLAQAVEYWLELNHESARSLAGEAADALVTAADAAERVYAYPAAVRHRLRAILIDERARDAGAEPIIDTPVVLQQAASASFLGGDGERARDLGIMALHEAEVRKDVESQCQIHAALAAYSWDMGDETTANGHAASAQQLLSDGVPPETRANVLASTGRFLMLQARFADAIPICREAIAAADSVVGAGSARASALISLATCLEAVGLSDEAEGTFLEGRRQAELANDGFDLTRYFNNYLGVLENQGRIDESEALVREGIEVIARYGLDRSYGAGLSLRLVGHLEWHGRPEDALEIASRVAEYRLLGADAVDARLDIGIALMDMGHLDEARSAIRAARVPAMRYQPKGSLAPSDMLASIELHAALVELWAGHLDLAAAGFELASRYWPAFKQIDRVRAQMLLVRMSADLAADARRRSDSVAEASAVAKARAHALLAESEADVRHELPGQWGWQGDLWLLQVVPELARAEGRLDPGGWGTVADMAADYRFPWGECYARLRQAEDLVASDSPVSEIASVIERGIEVSFACVPARRELEQLARSVGLLTEGRH
jgi:class 3 adenylate cyclase/tetratricopeptide (TPR) repeat protein